MAVSTLYLMLVPLLYHTRILLLSLSLFIWYCRTSGGDVPTHQKISLHEIHMKIKEVLVQYYRFSFWHSFDHFVWLKFFFTFSLVFCWLCWILHFGRLISVFCMLLIGISLCFFTFFVSLIFLSFGEFQPVMMTITTVKTIDYWMFLWKQSMIDFNQSITF